MTVTTVAGPGDRIDHWRGRASVLERELRETKRRDPERAKELAEELSVAQRTAAVLEAGYEEMPLPNHKGWERDGLVLDPRIFPWNFSTSIFVPACLFALGLFVFLTAGPVAALTSLSSITQAASIAGVIFGAGLVILTVLAVLDWFNTQVMIGSGLDPHRSHNILASQPPEHVMARYENAEKSGLFDRVRVTAPQEAFSRVVVGLDPIIYGVIGDHYFFIAAWDL